MPRPTLPPSSTRVQFPTAINGFMPPISLPAALDSIPSAIQLGHIQQDTEPPPSQTSNTQPNQLQFSDSAPMSLRGGMPPVPAKLVKQIQEGSFIEMAELLPDLL